jgi:hypothetical protein
MAGFPNKLGIAVGGEAAGEELGFDQALVRALRAAWRPQARLAAG